MKSIAWGTRILAISLLITLVLVSGCILDFGKNNLDFGNSGAAQKALACFCQTYGDPTTYSGPPRLIAPLVSTELRDNIPQDKVTRFSTDTNSIFFWVIYQNFPQGDDLHLSWIFQNKVVTTITKKTGSKTGVAFGEFVRPVAGWPIGTHTITIEGGGNSTQVTFAIANSPTERTVFDFTSLEGVSCPDLISNIPVPQLPDSTNVTPPGSNGDYSISGRTSNPVITCNPPNNTIQFMGTTGRAVTPGTPVTLILFNKPGSGTQDLPPEGTPLGSTNTKNDGGWEYTWNGNVLNVPWYLLRNDQEYMVKAMLPNGIYTQVSFRYQCPLPTQYIWVSGQISNTELSCYPPNYTIQFSGNTYPAATPGTLVQLKLFNLPDAGTQEILIGSTNTRSDGSYEYSWNGVVPGYMLKNGQKYSVKAIFPDSGMSTRASFLYQCSDPEGKWQIYGGPTNSVLSCAPPNNTIKFTGFTGPSVTRGIDIQLKLFHMPGAGDQEILLGSTNTRNDGTWEYTWNGSAAGYSFKEGPEYGVKAVLPWRYTKMGFTYRCPK